MAETDVTLGILGNKLDNMDGKLDDIHSQVSNLNGTVRANEIKIVRLEERQTTWGRLQAAFTVIASAIAAFLGSQK